MDPEPRTDGRFGLNGLSAIGDVTGDGIGDIAIGAPLKSSSAGGVYLFSGAEGRRVRTLRSPKSQSGAFGGKIEALGDLNGDGVPELWIKEDLATLTHLYDGLTSKLLTTIKYPGLVHTQAGPKFGIGTVRQATPPGILAYVFAAPAVANYEGRVYYMPFTPLQPTRLKTLGRTASGFRLQVTGEPGRKLEIQASSDFKSWEAISALTTGTEPVEAEDSTAADLAHRFYRAVQKE